MARKFTNGLHGTKGTDNFINRGKIYIEFFHIPSGMTVSFKGFITAFTDNYAVDFNQQDVYGRMDPIAVYKNTKRTLSLSWTVVAESDEEAYDNFGKVQKYIQMLYPSYNKFISKGQSVNSLTSATTLGSPPLMKIKFMNLISNASTMKDTDMKTSFTQDRSVKGLKNYRRKRKKLEINYDHGGTAEDTGLLVVPGNINIDPMLADRGALLFGGAGKSSVSMIPLEFTMATDFTVLHEHDLGFEQVRKVTTSKASTGSSQASGNPNTQASNNRQQNNNTTRSKSKKKNATKRKVYKNVSTAKKHESFERFPYGLKTIRK